LKDLVELGDLQSKVKKVRLVEKLGKQGFHYDIKKLFEPITKAVTDSNQKLLEETTSNTKAIENLVESNKYVKTLESMHKNEVIHSSLIRPIARLLVPETKSQLRLCEDPDSENWHDYVMNGEKVTIYNDELVFSESGKIFTLRGDVLKMLTDYKFDTTDSPDAKVNIDIMDEMHFDIHARGKSLRDETNLTKEVY